MPRELKVNDNNKITLVDGMTGEKFWVTHKTVTTDKRVAYQSANMNILTSKTGNGTEALYKMQVEWGKEYLTSMQPGYLLYDGKPIDCTQDGWKEQVAITASDILVGLVKYLFGNNTNVIKEDPHPFEKS